MDKEMSGEEILNTAPEAPIEEGYKPIFTSPEVLESLRPEDIKAITIEDITPDFLEQTKKMLRYLSDFSAAGLSGVQVGDNRSYFVYWNEKAEPRAVYNPNYYPNSNAKTSFIEECLTYGRNLKFFVRRYKRIRASWYEYDPEQGLVKRSKALSGFDAEVFQHETDHCHAKTVAQVGQVILR